jgi:hypothetical protein
MVRSAAMRTCHLVTQAYGLEEIRVQGLYLAHSALARAGDVDLRVHLYVDEPAFFRGVADRVELHAMTPERIAEWQGPLRFVHRLKAKMIEDLVAAHPADPILYLDADTFFVRDVAEVFSRIGPGRAVMHVKEYPVATTETGQLRRFRKHMRPLSFEGRPIDLDGWMWNAGAVGMDPAQFGVVPRWLRFIDELYPRYRKGLVEQYSISLLLQREAELAPCDDAVFHYWFQKDEYVARIREHLGALARLPPAMQAEFLRARRIELPPPAERKHRRRGLLARLLGR